MKTRILTALVALAVFVPFLIKGGNYFLFLSIFLSFITVYEITKICFGYINKSVIFLSYIVVLGIFFREQINNNILVIGCLLVAFLLLAEIILSGHKVKIIDISTVLFLSYYVAIGFFAFYTLRIVDIVALGYLVLTIWITDSAAYFGGMKYGKRKLSANISPNKSIEGSVIGTLSSIVMAVIFYLVSDLFSNLFIAILVTIIISVVGQMGDLIESAYKREYKVKDSSNLLPGHGGVFDRFDSIILSSPMLLALLEVIR